MTDNKKVSLFFPIELIDVREPKLNSNIFKIDDDDSHMNSILINSSKY